MDNSNFNDDLDLKINRIKRQSTSVDDPTTSALKAGLMKLIIDTKDEDIALKIDGEQYRKIGIHDEWRSVDLGSSKTAYFSYQEKATKEFIYRFNKCGILSDQVGMGKTIEAGMIISELAYKKELGSLLILVPNENMAEKWENELAKKFGFRNYFKDITLVSNYKEKKISSDDLPKVCSVKCMNDLYTLIYNAYDSLHPLNGVQFDSVITETASHLWDKIITKDRIVQVKKQIDIITESIKLTNHKTFKMAVLNQIYAPLISEMVKEISENMGFYSIFKASNYEFNNKGQYYHIVDMLLDTPIKGNNSTLGIFDRIIDKEIVIKSIVNEFDFVKSIRGRKVMSDIEERNKKASLTSMNFMNSYKDLHEIAKAIKDKYAILIVSKIVKHGDSNINLLDHKLNIGFESDTVRYCSTNTTINKGYRFIDMLIEMTYKTLIVDEAHDFIKVSHKRKMSPEITKHNDYLIRQKSGIEFLDLDLNNPYTSTDKYFIFPLYNDYYFIEKSCLYVEVKALSERCTRKIFMTATPIKSDLVDFYLLYLLTDNVDSVEVRKILKNPQDITQISSLLLKKLSSNQIKALNYYTHEDIVVRYIYNLYNIRRDSLKGDFKDKIHQLVSEIISTEIVYLDALNDIVTNAARIQFQDTFAIRDKQGKLIEISSLSDLVSSDDGVKKWQNMYQQIGIRSTRHQTFKLSDEYLELLKEVQRDKYRNLPVWSRRNGITVYIHQMDNFFDQIIVDRLNEKKHLREIHEIDEFSELRKSTIDHPKERDIQNLQNELNETIIRINEEDYTDKIKEEKIAFELKNTQQSILNLDKLYAPKETALSIYKYINEQLTGNLSIADYRSSRIRDYDDFKLHMVVKLMTNGIATNDDNGTIRIKDKVLLFSDAQTQLKVYNWLLEDMNQRSFEEKGISLEQYQTSYRHDPLWYYNAQKKNPEDRWNITTDIRTLNDTQGNYLIIVEPDKYEEGVDLQTSNTLINFDIKFDPLRMEQRIGRIDRVKLGSEQSNLQIISFTPLNDLSGFMVDFLANELKMFNRWRGDTTGIVTMPLGDKPNSATFNDAMLALNDAYKAIYNSDFSHYMDSLNKIELLNDLFFDKGINKIGQIKKKDQQTLHDFQYLKDNKNIVNDIIFNTYTNNRDGDQGKILFGALRPLANRKSFEDNEITADSLNSHENNLEHLQSSIHQYYETNINRINAKIDKIHSLYKDKGDEMQKIEASNTAREYNDYTVMSVELDSFLKEYTNFKNGALANKPLGILYIEKSEADLSLEPILNRYRSVVNKYLDPLIDLFDKLSSQVTDKSDKMSKFISYITMEEFRIMADNHE